MAELKPRPDYDWSRVRWGAPDDRVSYSCSVCQAPIGEKDVPLRLWTEDGRAAVFCDQCAADLFGR